MGIQLIIIIILVILLIGTIGLLHRGFSYYNKYENFRILKYIKISDIYDNLKSGDIILYKCNTISLPSVFLTHVYFSHIGIVLKSGNDLFISETNPSFEYIPSNYNNVNSFLNAKGGWKTKYGSDILPLLVRIKYYPGDSFLVRLNKPLDAEKQKILIKYAHEQCPYPTIIQGLSIFIEENFGKPKTRARHCFQHVGYLLDKMGITNNISDHGIYSICKKMANIYNKKLNDGYQYETPIKILYDV